MKHAIEFCTCTDLKCPCHPVNHDQGCTLCILKNLKEKEIPSCFFNDIDCEKPTDNWHYEDFAALVMAARKYYVYILRCADGTYYTGYTNDPERRTRVHNSGKGAKYTRSRRPVELIYTEEFYDKREAQRREYAIKQLTRAEKEQLIMSD